MERSFENPIRARLEKKVELEAEIRELEENRSALKRDLDAHKIPEIAEEIDKIDKLLMSKKIEVHILSEASGETE